jgi:peptidoglycan-associated lipoprotein
MNRRVLLIAAVLFALPLVVACAPAKEPISPSVGLTQPVDPPKEPYLGRGASRVETETLYSIWLTDSVRMVCAGPDPFFTFDSSKPMGDDQPTMKNLVACMTSGPLRGKTIRLTGHADPRGSVAYNDKLGLQRADKVKEFLLTNGVDPARVLTASAGKADASVEPKDWPTDRRVAIQVVQ